MAVKPLGSLPNIRKYRKFAFGSYVTASISGDWTITSIVSGLSFKPDLVITGMSGGGRNFASYMAAVAGVYQSLYSGGSWGKPGSESFNLGYVRPDTALFVPGGFTVYNYNDDTVAAVYNVGWAAFGW